MGLPYTIKIQTPLEVSWNRLLGQGLWLSTIYILLVCWRNTRVGSLPSGLCALGPLWPISSPNWESVSCMSKDYTRAMMICPVMGSVPWLISDFELDLWLSIVNLKGADAFWLMWYNRWIHLSLWFVLLTCTLPKFLLLATWIILLID